MKTILLLGELGKKFGRKHRFDVKSVGEAVRALVANFPPLEKYLMESDPAKVQYQVIVDKETLPDETHLHDPIGNAQTIKFVPVLMGAGGNGVLQTIAGAVLVVVGVVVGVAFGWTGIGAQVGVGLIFAGASMMIGGVVQMLSPQPKTSIGTDQGTVENKQSYSFNGPVNISAQGAPVPIGYGRMIVGSAVISAGIVTEEY